MTAVSPRPMADLARDYGLKDEEYAKIIVTLRSEKKAVDMGVFSVMW